jgi:hypothetical protein
MVTTLGEPVMPRASVAAQALCGRKVTTTFNEDCLKLSWAS